jgi:hypothetical protein
VSILAVSMYFAPQPPAPWAADDRDWFAAHPDRSHRLREAYPGEWPAEAGNMLHAVVKQMQRGERLRLPITMTAGLLEGPRGNWTADDLPEEAVWAIFDLTMEATKNGDHRGVTVADIRARWQTLKPHGSG